MFCDKCGTQLQDFVKFCPKCGAPVPVSEDVAPAEMNQAASQSAATQGKQPKKMMPFLIAGAAIAVVLIVVVANAANIGNFFRRTFSSPEKYYQYVEGKEAEELASIVGDWYKLYFLDRKDDMNSASNAAVEVELDEAGQELLELAGLGGVDLSWLKSASLSGELAINGERFNLNLTSALNKTSVLSFFMTVDLGEGEAYLQIPELTDKYIGMDLEDTMGYTYDELSDSWKDLMESYEDFFDSLTGQAELEKLFDKYLKIALGCVEDVNKETRTLEVEGVEQKCTALEVTIDSRTLADMLGAILEEAEDDQALKKLIVDLTEVVDEDDDDIYDDFMDELEYLQNSLNSSQGGEKMVMTVYVGSKGNVVGREIEIDGDTFSMLMPQKGKSFGYELSLTEGRQSISLTGSGKRSGDKIDGDFRLRYTGATILEITTDDLDLATLKKGQLNGSMEVSIGSGIGTVVGTVPGASMIQDMRFSLTAKSSDKSSEYKFGLIYDDDSLGYITVSGGSKRSSGINIPNEKDVYFMEDVQNLVYWAQEINWDRFVANLEKANLPRSATRAVESFGQALQDGGLEDMLSYLLWNYYLY